MKNSKRLTAIFMAAVLTLSMAVPAFAEWGANAPGTVVASVEAARQTVANTRPANAGAVVEWINDNVLNAVGYELVTASQTTLTVRAQQPETGAGSDGVPGEIDGTVVLTWDDPVGAGPFTHDITFSNVVIPYLPYTPASTGETATRDNDGWGSPVVIDGTGNVINVDLTAVSEVTLPTSTAFDFSVDPWGLADQAGNVEITDPTARVGQIVSDETAFIVNRSAFPINVAVALTAGGTGVTYIPFSADFNANLDNRRIAVNGTPEAPSSAANILMYVVSSADEIRYDDLSSADPDFADRGVVLGTTASTLNFQFAAGEIDINMNEDPPEAALATNGGRGTALELGGYVNSNMLAWTGATPPEASISVTFTITDASVPATDFVTGIYGLRELGFTNVLNLMDADAVQGFVTSPSWITGTATAITVDLNTAVLETDGALLIPFTFLLNSLDRVTNAGGTNVTGFSQVGNFVRVSPEALATARGASPLARRILLTGTTDIFTVTFNYTRA